jgi:hypothetical protein
MASIALALRRIKDDLQPFIPETMILRACRESGHEYRERILDPVTTIHVFILQILNFNTALTHLRHLAKQPFTAAAFCKARIRLPLAVFQKLLRRSAAAMLRGSGRLRRRWHGLRVYLVDGSATIAPDTPDLQKQFPQRKSQKPGCGFPEVKILGLFDAFTGLLLEVLCFNIFHEDRSQVCRLHPLLRKGDLLVADRGFCSYVHLALLAGGGVLALFRLHQRQIISFRPHRKSRRKGQKGKPNSVFIRRLGKYDQIVRWNKPAWRPKWMNPKQWREIPASLLVRELRFCIAAKGQRTRVVTIATTLLDPHRYPKPEIAALYQVRWTVETHLGELKTTLRMRRVKSQSAQGVQKELLIYALVYNLVHLLMLPAARQQHVTPDRISFIDTVRWLLSARPGEKLPDLVTNPYRPGRHEPRVVKDRHDTYPYLNRPRSELHKAMRRQVATG